MGTDGGGRDDPCWSLLSVEEGWLVVWSVGVSCQIVGNPGPFINDTG